MKVLVIGGNGFIGTNLVDALLADGHQVRVLDRYPSRFRAPNPRVEYITGDIGNHGEMHEAVIGCDLVYHLAYTSLPQTSNEDPIHDIRSNVVDTVQLLQDCRDSGVSKVIFISSGGTVYGIPQSTPIKEDHPTEPICSYGITKLAIEKYLHLFHRLWNLEYVVARLSNPYGELQNPFAKQGAIGVFLGDIALEKPITIFGDGNVIRDYLYIGDTVNALVKAGHYQPGPNDPRLFNIGSGQGQSLNDIVEIMKEVVDKPFKVEYIPARKVDVPANVLDIERARKHLGFEPQTNLKEGIEKAWKWVKSLNLESANQRV